MKSSKLDLSKVLVGQAKVSTMHTRLIEYLQEKKRTGKARGNPEDWLFEVLKTGLVARPKDHAFNVLLKHCAEDAIERNDFSFFIRLGRALEHRKKVPLEPTIEKISLVLVAKWSAFQQFSDSALVALFTKSGMPITLDALRKRRQRLGLTRDKKPTILKF